MGQALYRKTRPKKLDEVIGQKHITTTLKNALKTGKISHAYLFTGPRGVGKTSVARILAHEVNGFEYDDANYNIDIIEIDAASNRRIDEIRDLRDKVHIAPTSGKYKVYIIDEVHMLTKEAFNALLKTLEEPPAHVIFILATTESHKLPETIVSRTQRFSFKPIEPATVVEHLRSIAKSEKLEADDKALQLIAEHGEGSFRDSIGLLDQAGASGNKISLDSVQLLLGIAPEMAIDGLIKDLSSGSAGQLLRGLRSLIEQGYGAASIAKQLAQRLRQQLIDQQLTLSNSQTLKLLKKLIDVPASASPESLLELCLLDLVMDNDEGLPIIEAAPITEPEPEPEEQPKPQLNQPIDDVPQLVDKPSTSVVQDFSLDMWPTILSTIKNSHNTLYSIVRMGKPAFDGKTLTLSFEFAFHQKRLEEVKNKQIINAVLKQHVNQPIEIVSIVAPSLTKKSSKKSSDSQIKTINNIFGVGEVLDS